MAVVFVLAGLTAGAQANNAIAARDRLQPLAAGAVNIGGYLGNKIGFCINNRIVLQPAAPLIRIFKTKNLDPGVIGASLLVNGQLPPHWPAGINPTRC